MSTRRTRVAGATSAPKTTPAVVSNATPIDQAPAPGGVVPEGTATAPAVPSTEPLPSDQATAAQRPADGTGTMEPTAADLGRALGERPSVVPETPPREDLTAPATEGDVKRGAVAMERVPGTVPLPADQITPVAPVAVEPAPSLRAQLALLSDDDRAALREAIGSPAPGDELADDPFEGVRLFPVDYEVERDGVTYEAGDKIALTFGEYQHFVRATAVTTDWLRGEVEPA